MHDDATFLEEAARYIMSLRLLRSNEYREELLPSMTDATIARGCRLYEYATSEQRDVFSSSLDRTLGYLLDTFAIRMAMFSVRAASHHALRKGVLAVVMSLDCPDVDPRDSALAALRLLYQSASRLLQAPGDVFARTQHIAVRPQSRSILGGYVGPDASVRPLAEYGWREEDGPAGIVYAFGTRPVPQGLIKTSGACTPPT